MDLEVGTRVRVLPWEMFYEIALNTDLTTLLARLCATNKEMQSISTNPGFWHRKVLHDYNIPPLNIPDPKKYYIELVRGRSFIVAISETINAKRLKPEVKLFRGMNLMKVILTILLKQDETVYLKSAPTGCGREVIAKLNQQEFWVFAFGKTYSHLLETTADWTAAYDDDAKYLELRCVQRAKDIIGYVRLKKPNGEYYYQALLECMDTLPMLLLYLRHHLGDVIVSIPDLKLQDIDLYHSPLCFENNPKLGYDFCTNILTAHINDREKGLYPIIPGTIKPREEK